MEDILKNNTYKVLELFFIYPERNFHVREIARTLKLNHATVSKHLKVLKKKNLILIDKNTLYPTYYANIENETYLFYKKQYLISKIYDSEVIEKIKKLVFPSSIILFGSAAKGTSNENSDIDLFVEAEKKNIALFKYEKLLGHKINLLFEPKIGNLPKNLANNILNGYVLYGFVRWKWAGKNV